MVVIELFSRRYVPQLKKIVSEPAARIEVDGAKLTVVEGDPGWSLLTDTVVDHPYREDENLTFEEDPELWALTLPEAFRTGDTVVEARQLRRAAEREETRSASPVADRAAAAGWR